MSIEQQTFETHLASFRQEVETCTQLLYTHLTIHNVAARHKKVHALLNHYPYFWITTLYGLQCSGFIVLGRIFDQNSAFNVDRLLGYAQQHANLFSKPALAARKKEGSRNADQWLDKYVARAYEPTAKDFRYLRKQVAKHRRLYDSTYDAIRDQVYAHRQFTDSPSVDALFQKVQISDLQHHLVFLNRLYRAIWELYHNGRKPVLRPMPHSASNMLRACRQRWKQGPIQQVIVKETEALLKSISS